MRYFGPFKVLDRIGKVAYKLELPPTAKIHSVFHISVLKKCIGAPTTTTIPTPLLIDDIGVQLHPQIVLGHRMIKKNDRWHEEVLIKWQSLLSEEATWESYEQMQQQFPSFDLEGKVNFNGRGNDNSAMKIKKKSGPKYTRESRDKIGMA